VIIAITIATALDRYNAISTTSITKLTILRREDNANIGGDSGTREITHRSHSQNSAGSRSDACMIRTTQHGALGMTRLESI
jgi:hypothetical protein